MHAHMGMRCREAVFEDRASRTAGELTADEAELRGLELKPSSNRQGRTQKPGHMPKASASGGTQVITGVSCTQMRAPISA